MMTKKDTKNSVTVLPGNGLKGAIVVPGDKSISHRAVILGSIADGDTFVENFLEGEDTLATLAAFRAMGVEMVPGNKILQIKGVGLRGLKEPEDVIDAENSGTTARLLAGLLAGQGFFSVITGDASLRKRPMKRVIEPLTKMGASISARNNDSLLPLAITGKGLKGIEYQTPVASAQLKSSLLLAGLYAEGETVITEPEKSRDHTERMLKRFGVAVEVDANATRIRPVKALPTPGRVIVPGDISSAAFFMVGAMITPDSEVLIHNLGLNPTRTGIIDILKKMGGNLTVSDYVVSSTGEDVGLIMVKSSNLKAINIDGSLLLPAIDEFPIICIAAAFAKGVTVISGAKELRVKESDRVRAMAGVLTALGIGNQETTDGIAITGVGNKNVKGGFTRGSLGDHRVAMALAIAALRTEKGIVIEDADSVDVSFPGFFELLNNIRMV